MGVGWSPEGAYTNQLDSAAPSMGPPTVGFEYQDPARHLGELRAGCLWPAGSILLGFCLKLSSLWLAANFTLKHTDGPALSC